MTLNSPWEVTFTVTVDGTDISNRVLGMEFKQSICSPGGHLDIEVAPNALSVDIVPYMDVVVTIDGTKVFTGYTQNDVVARRPVQQTIVCEDAIAKVRDTWNTDMYLSSNGTQSISYWVSYFLSLAGVSSSVSSGGPTAPEKDFGITNALSEVTELLQFVNWQITTNANGVIVVGQNSKNYFDYSEIGVITYERETSDHWLRNRAVIIGASEESSVVVDNDVPELGTEIRAGIVASPYIYWPGTAHRLAWYLLNEFSNPWDVRHIETTGQPQIRVGSTVHFHHEWQGVVDDHYGLVTTLEWRINPDVGYMMVVTVDEKCPTFWITDTEPLILYCATEGRGVWRSNDNGVNWYNISGEELDNGDSHSYVKDIHVVKGESIIGSDDTVWAATLGGIWRTETGDAPWTNMTATYMDGKAQSMDWWGVRCGPFLSNRVYALGNYKADSIRWTIYMYISFDNGLTWSSYPVNSWDGVTITNP